MDCLQLWVLYAGDECGVTLGADCNTCSGGVTDSLSLVLESLS